MTVLVTGTKGAARGTYTDCERFGAHLTELAAERQLAQGA